MTWRGGQREAARQVTSDRIPFVKQVAGIRPLVQVCSLPFAWTISCCEHFFFHASRNIILNGWLPFYIWL